MSRQKPESGHRTHHSFSWMWIRFLYTKDRDSNKGEDSFSLVRGSWFVV